MKYLNYAYNDGLTVVFTNTAWINATELAKAFNKRIDKYLDNVDTRNYIGMLCDEFNTTNPNEFIKTQEGRYGGTWLHPEMGVHFAVWLDMYFGRWCYKQIRAILEQGDVKEDWRRARHMSAASYKIMTEAVQTSREYENKETKSYHYSNEARLINHALTNSFSSIDRNTLPFSELDILAKLEAKNTAMLYNHVSYDVRKAALEEYSNILRNNIPQGK